jgi:plasmid maintenance system antidote protein VapI
MQTKVNKTKFWRFLEKQNPLKKAEELLGLIRPGDKLVKYFIIPSGLTLDEMMKKSGMPVKYIVQIIHSERSITPGIASLFDRCFGWPAQALLDWQLLYEIEAKVLGQEIFLADLALHMLGQEKFLADVEDRIKMLKKDRAVVRRRLPARLRS